MKRRTQEIRRFILENIDDYGNVRVNEVVKKFEISRQAIFKNVRRFAQMLIAELFEYGGL